MTGVLRSAMRGAMRNPMRSALAVAIGSATPFVPIVDPTHAQVGDSITQFGMQGISLNGVTLTRDSAGVITAAKTNHGIYGTPACNIVNCTNDEAYEAFANTTNVGTNSFSYPTSVTGAAGSIAGTANTQAVVQTRHETVGSWVWYQSAVGGGARNLGNFGQGGDRADQMAPAVVKALATGARIIEYEGGANDINGGADGPTTLARNIARINEIVDGGAIALVSSIAPFGAANATVDKNTAILHVNAGMAALDDDTNILYVDTHSLLVDPATQGTTGAAFSWATKDGLHPGQRASKIKGEAKAARLAGKIVVSNCLPTGSGNMPTIPGFTAIRNLGPWAATGGGFNGTGSSGTVPPNAQVFSSNAATTVVNSLVDRGSAALGYHHQQVITPNGAHTVTNHWLTNSGNTLAALGLAVGDTIMFAVEIGHSGAVAANLIALNIKVQSNSSGSFGLGSCGDFISAANSTYRNDEMADAIFLTGEFKITTGTTHILAFLEAKFGAAGSALTLLNGKVVLFKKNP